MLSFIPSPIIGILAFILHIINTILWISIFFPISLIKIIPIRKIRITCSKLLNNVASLWASWVIKITELTQKINWEIKFDHNLSKKDSYLIFSNHQSWIDIIVMLKIFNGKIPFFRFFLKKQLIYVPFLGFAWWALDYPFMKRYSKEYLKKYPEKKGKDLEITKKSCEKFRYIPVSIINFLEGTRFTKEKHKKQNSSFNNLLKPKAGGVSFVLDIMGKKLKDILDVTIIYPENNKKFWDFLNGKVKKIIVDIRTIEISEDLMGNYSDDENYKKYFQNWINGIWNFKDKKIDKYKTELNN